MDENNKEKLEPVATRTFNHYDEMYKVVDFLNKTLKHKKLMFGLSKNGDGSMTITIYEI